MKRPSLRRLTRALTVPAALLALGLMVVNGSNAAFTATTSSPGNNWATGQVSLLNDTNAFAAPVGAAAFSVTNLKPGQTGIKCIVVKSNGSLPATVRLYAANALATNALDAQLNLSIDFAAGQFTNCASFPASPTNVYSSTLALLPTTAAAGLGTWAPTGTGPTTPEYATYRFTWTLNAAAPNTVMGSTAAADFVWTATNS
jgi:hypothetical protein